MRSRSPVCVFLLVSIAACGGGGARSAGDAGTDVAGGDATDQSSPTERPGTGDDASCTSAPVDPIPAGGTCSPTVTSCAAPRDECRGSSLRAALKPALAACQVACGELAVGFSAGCATALIVRYGATDEQAACLKEALFTARFDCVPTDGWQRLYVGSCTIL